MNKKVTSFLMALAMFVCLLPVVTKQASAGMYTVELTCYANADNVLIDGKAVSGSVGKSLRRGSYLKSDFNRIKATRSGYVFLGWYTAASGGQKVTGDNVDSLYCKACPNQTGYLKIYAHWARLVITSSGNGKIYPVGGSTNATLQNLYGHTWTLSKIDSVSGSSWGSWLTPSFSNGYATFKTRTKNNELVDRKARAWFTDQYGNAISMEIIHLCIDSLFKASNGTYNDRYKNVVKKAGSKPLDYNMGYARWFTNCCTDSAMMDLLNRRMAYDGYLKKTCYFDIRDVLEGIAVGGYDASKVTVSSGGDLTTPGWGSEYTYNFPSNETELTTTFRNKYGTSGTPKSYSVTFKVIKKGSTDIKSRIKSLLRTHPEGVFVYSNAGGDHALIIVGYDSNGFWYVDNGTRDIGQILYDQTWFKIGHKCTEEDFFNGIFRIAYVN